MKHPRARRDGLIVQKVEGETLVYDLDRHRAYCLSPAAAVVWESSDGRTDVAALALRVREATGASADPTLVELALSDLRRARLLEKVLAPAGRGVTRRELVRRAGLGAAATLVASIVAPTAAQAATACTNAACTSGTGTPNCCCAGTSRICRQTGPNFNCNGAAC